LRDKSVLTAAASWTARQNDHIATDTNRGNTRVMKDAIYAFAAMLCGIGFYFTIIGVLDLPAACLSLALFIALVLSAWVFERDDTSV
jgi:hypothetical protein